jgi:hypothetical protein
MARVPPPTNSAKGVQTPPVIALANLEERGSALMRMNFRVSEEFHREFKLYAVQHGMTMGHLLQESFKMLRDKRDR